MRTALLALILLAGALVAPEANAHGAPTPGESFTRLLADQNDDCGGDGGAQTGSCRGADDLIALDIQETWRAGNTLVFRFWLDKGSTYPITNTLTFASTAGPKTLAMTTSDDGTFESAAGFDGIGSTRSVADGDRFTVDGYVAVAKLGLNVGDKLSNFRVESKSGSNLGDVMPGSCKTNLGADCPPPAPGQDSTSYTKPDYTLRGPTYYATITTGATSIEASAGGDSNSVQIQVRNTLLHQNQVLTVTVTSLDGAVAGLYVGSDPVAGAYLSKVEVALSGKAMATVHVRLHGERDAAQGAVGIIVTTDLGGRNELQLPYHVTAAQPQSSTQSTNASAWPAAALLVVVVALAAMRRRA